ncbi:hypothetical protein QQF64_031472 [Cirrhinus molitorella]|uniref:ribonuclease H n=1 Tax=Cirrhinus molitorella TaxID=172907 RepID=A0ABR3MX17_9TELE
MIIGNDLAGGKVRPLPEVVDNPFDEPPVLNKDHAADLTLFPACAITRAQSRKFHNVVDLSDSFLLDDEDTPQPVVFQPKEFDLKSLSPVTGAEDVAVTRELIETKPIGYYFEDGLLMRKWTPSVAVRETVQESLGFSPAKLVFAHTVRGPLKLLKENWLSEGNSVVNVLDYVSSFRERLHRACEFAQSALSDAQSKMKEHFDKCATARSFEKGDKVLVLLPLPGSTLQAKFSGPYVVERKLSDTDYIICTPDRRRKTQVCHINMIKCYVVRGEEKESKSSVIPSVPISVVPLSCLDDDNDELCLRSMPTSSTNVIKHDIEVCGHSPIKQNAYRVNPAKRKIIESEVKYLLENGLAVPSSSAWSLPCLLVPKPDGTHRFCTDYRKVNAITKPDSFPLPLMEDCVDNVGSAQFVTKLDLLKGYWQVPLTERAAEIATFVTPDNFLNYTVMAFGLRNAPATFQRLMNSVLAGVQNCKAYLDDIVVYSTSWKEHVDIVYGFHTDFLLSCHATAIQPSLKLSNCLVEFGRTAVGDRTTAVLYLENQQPQPPPHISTGHKAAAQLFTFSVPENSDITITPTSGRVLPGQKCLVQVTFSPTLSDDAISAEALRWREEFHNDTSNCQYTEADTKKMETSLFLVKDHCSKVMSANGSLVHSPSPADIQAGCFEYLAVKASLLRSFNERHVRHVISCFTSSSDIVLDTSEEPRYSPHETLYLELRCPVIRPALLLISDSGHNTIYFNQVAVGQKVLKKVIIQNISSETVKLTSSLLDVTGPFSVLNAMRSIGPEDTHTLLIAFTPFLAKKYYETLEVSCSQMMLKLALCGEAVNPIITCSNEGHIKFDYVPVNESTSQTFRLQNMSSLDVRFSVLLESHFLTERNDRILAVMDSTVHVGTQNYSGMSVFRASPSGGAITSDGAVDITVTFHPDHESLHYRDVLRVQLMNKQTVCMLELWGSSCQHNMFVCGGDPVDVCSESLIPSHIYTSGLIKHEESKSLLLTLRSEYQEGRAIVATRRLHVGCVYSTKPTTKKMIEFIWENISPVEQQGFKVAPMQGIVDAGHECLITITWMPPSGLTPNAVVQACALLTIRGDETEVYRVTLMAHTDKNTST